MLFVLLFFFLFVCLHFITCADDPVMSVTLAVVTVTVLSGHPPVSGIADTLATVAGTCKAHTRTHTSFLFIQAFDSVFSLFAVNSLFYTED